MPSAQATFFGTIFVSFLEAAALVRHWDYVAGASTRSITLYCVGINFTIVVLYVVFVQRLLFSPLRHIPGPKGSNIILGEFLHEFDNPPGESFRKWVNTVPNEGLLSYRTLFNARQLIATSPETLKSVMSDNAYDWEKPDVLINVLKKVIGVGLILVEGDVHKFQRKHLLPSFRMQHIKQLYPIFWKKACELNDTLLAEGPHVDPASATEKGFEVEIGAFTTRATLDIIGIAGLGRDFNSLKNPNDELVQKYNWLLEPTKEKAAWFVSHIMAPGLMAYVPWELTRRVNAIQKELTTYARDLIRDRRASFKKDPKLADSMDDIISLLVKSNDFTDEELANQAMTMMAAGHETTSSALSWVTFLLAKHPEIQDRLRAEIRASLPDPASGEAITAADIDRLALLSAVCSETLRLYPTVPVTGRFNTRDTHIGDVLVPKHTFIILSPWAINRNKQYWGEAADEFIPERWINADGTSNKNGGARSNYNQITFLHGPRSCIGQDFAQSELKCLVAALIGKFSFELARPDANDQYTPAGVVTTKALKGMYVRVKEVPGW